MAQNQFGVMQGRLSPPEAGRLQSFPRSSWRREIEQAHSAGVAYIEWIYDDYGASVNPISTPEGITELNHLKRQHGIATPAICGDWFVEFPLIRCTAEEQKERELTLHGMLHKAREIGASRIVLPFVDASSIRTGEEKETVLQALSRALPVAEETGIELHLEADFPPSDFADFLARINHPMVKVNYDTGNSSGLGYIPTEEFQAYGRRIGSIHIKDRLRLPGGAVATRPLGEGSADFERVFNSIRSIGYKAGFTLQVARGEDGDEVNWIRKQIEFIRRFLT